MEKLTVVVASILCILIFAVAIVCVDIWKINTELDKWYRTTQRGVMIGEIIERYELMLRQKLIELTLLVAATVTVAVVSFRSIRHKHMMKNLLKNLFYGLAGAFLITMMFLVIFFVLLFLPIRYNNPLLAGVLSALITGIIVVRILTDKWIIGLATVVSAAILLCIGCFLVYQGARNYLFGSPLWLLFGPVMMVFGVPWLIGGIIVAWKIKTPNIKVSDKWIIGLVAGAFDTILLYIGFFFLYWGALNWLSGGGRPAGLEYLMMVAGVPTTVGGIIVARKLKAYLFPPKPRQRAS